MTRDQLRDQLTVLYRLQMEAADIAAGKIGFPRCVEWQRDYVLACFDAMPALLVAAHEYYNI